jgi:electron transfer flavoprotein beta subunit
MRILVPIKQVPETSAVKMDPVTGTMIREGVEAILNPLDLYAVETALRLRELTDGEAIALSMGPPKAERALREAVSMGCDSAVLLTDPAFAGSDTWATSRVLAAAVQRLGGADVLLCGERATDGDTGQVGPGVAAWLELPVVTYVSRVEALQPGRATVRRLVEDGYEVLNVRLPAVLTVVKDIAAPRLPTLHGKRHARKMAVETWGAADLKLTPEEVGIKGSPTRVAKIFRPKVTREGVTIVATGEDGVRKAAERLVACLRSRGVIRP